MDIGTKFAGRIISLAFVKSPVFKERFHRNLPDCFGRIDCVSYTPRSSVHGRHLDSDDWSKLFLRTYQPRGLDGGSWGISQADG